MPNSSHPLQHSFLPLFVLFFFLSSSLATPLSLHHSIKQLKKTKPMEGGQEEVIIRISQQGVYHISVKNNKEELSFEEVFRLWQFHQDFRTKWIKALQEIPLNAYFWECKPYTLTNINQSTFKCVCVPSPRLESASPDPSTFSSHFSVCKTGVAIFQNLRKDALLLAPCPPEQQADFSHLKTFLDYGSEQQLHQLWRDVGKEAQERAKEMVNGEPVWLSTAGLGVYWLHVRLDRTPKYYTYVPFREPPSQ